jgi:probable F420-dependent oxidoreductase
VEIAVECERLGFDSVWVSDHLTFDLAKYGGSSEALGSLEPLVCLAVLAGATSRVRLGTMVLCNEFRHPVQLAREAALVDIASGGRLELGLGAGWYEREFAAAGLPLLRPGVRLERLGEAVEMLDLLFTGEPVSFQGKHYQLDEMMLRPASRPPIWVGGKGDRAMRLIARLGQGQDVGQEIGWNAAWFQDVEAYKERAALLEGAAVKRSIGQYAQGSAQEMTDRLAAFAAEGVEHAVMCFSKIPFGLDDPDDLTRFAQNVLPHAQNL